MWKGAALETGGAGGGGGGGDVFGGVQAWKLNEKPWVPVGTCLQFTQRKANVRDLHG